MRKLKPGTFYVNASQGFVVHDKEKGSYTFTPDSRRATTYPIWRDADQAGRDSVKDLGKDARYWNVLRPAIGQYATE